MQNLNLYDRVWPDFDVWRMLKLRDGIYVIEISSLRLVWTKYESYILQTSAVMSFSKLKHSC